MDETGIAKEKREGRKEMFLMGRDDQRDGGGNGMRDRRSGLQGEEGRPQVKSVVCWFLRY